MSPDLSPAKDSEPSFIAPSESREMAFRRLLREIEVRRDEFDRLAHIPRDVIGLMKAAGIFRSSTPALFGGEAVAPHLFLPSVERIAAVDGSAAWVAAFGSANTYLAALPLETQAIIYADGPDQVFAGGLYPLQRATRVEGGWNVSGRWRFASGCKGADWIGVGLSTGEGGGTYLAVGPASEIEIIDNWNVLGMQGTGSHDTTLTNKTFRDAWVCPRGAPGTVDEPLYRYPALAYQAEVHAACSLGLARAALDLASEMSGGAKIMPGAPRLIDRGYFRTGLAEGEAKFRAARAFYYEMAEQGWSELLRDGTVPLTTRNLMRLSATHAAQTCAEIVQTAYRIVGMAAVEKTHRMQHILRDSLVVTQHASLNDATLESAGLILAGAPAPAGYPG